MKINIEDTELEAFVLEEGDIAVPLEIFVPADGSETEITVYSRFLAEAEKFKAQFTEEPLSVKALEFWKKNLLPLMNELDFIPSPDLGDCICEYEMRTAEQLNCDILLTGTKLICGEEELFAYSNRTTHELQIDTNEEADACAVWIEDGSIVAYASVNDLLEEGNTVEINVECAPQWRCRGLAASCGAKLTEYLLKKGYSVRYCSRTSNKASNRVAEKIGFRKTGSRFSFVCYRNGAL